MKLPIATLCSILVGCAAEGDERVLSDYEYREGDREAEFEEFRRQCVSQGGYVYTEGISRSRIPSAKHRSSRVVCAVRRRGTIIG